MSILMPFKFKHFYKSYKNKKFKILDVGCGNHSASLTKEWFPDCEYYGLDNDKFYANDENDLNIMNGFFEINLNSLDFTSISDNYFDIIVIAHVIEHLPKGDIVILKLLQKLKPDGCIYIEYPSSRSTKFPSKKGSLNFYDDPTHCRLYELSELSSLLKKNGFSILKQGIRREILRVLLLPLFAIKWKITNGYVPGVVYWDLFGFAEFVFAKKNI
jgi:SAM-dependent methyltransferase